MQKLRFEFSTKDPAGGSNPVVLIGVVASGNLEVLIERTLQSRACFVDIATTTIGFDEVWYAVVSDFVERRSTGGLRFSINDCGARPDVVSLRLSQGLRLIAGNQPT